jgi:hypothetical protein
VNTPPPNRIADSKNTRIYRYDRGVCINGCGRPFTLECGLCRPCADKRAENARLWRLKKKLQISLTRPHNQNQNQP